MLEEIRTDNKLEERRLDNAWYWYGYYQGNIELQYYDRLLLMESTQWLQAEVVDLLTGKEVR